MPKYTYQKQIRRGTSFVSEMLLLSNTDKAYIDVCSKAVRNFPRYEGMSESCIVNRNCLFKAVS